MQFSFLMFKKCRLSKQTRDNFKFSLSQEEYKLKGMSPLFVTLVTGEARTI